MTVLVWWKAAVLFPSLLSVESAITNGLHILESPATGSLLSRDQPDFLYREQIRCIGNVPLDWRVLWLPGTDSAEEIQIEYDHPRRLCALPRYGGNPSWNIGMNCPIESPNYGWIMMLAVSERSSDHRIPKLLRGEMTEFCRLRCRCIFHEDSDEPSAERGTQDIIDSEALLPTPYDPNRYYGISDKYLPVSGIISLKLLFTNEGVLQPQSDGSFKKEPTMADTDKYRPPMCLGPVPEWQLPHPFEGHPGQFRYKDVGSLCKASWYRGSSAGNAGVVCQRSPFTNKYQVELLAFLAHPSLSRYNRHEPLRGAAVEAWCRRACVCQDYWDPHEVFQFTVDLGDLGSGGRTTAYFPDEGGVNFHIENRQGSSIKSVTFSATNSDENNQNQACLAGFQEQCSLDDSIAAVQLRRERLRKQHQRHRRPPIQPPTVYRPPAVAGVGAIAGASIDATIQEPVCGGTCEKFSDCVTAVQDADCRCRVIQTAQQAQAAGQGPFYPYYQSLCLPPLASFMSVGLGGRDLQQQQQQQQQQSTWPCACNATFVSHACCDAPDGMVWGAADSSTTTNAAVIGL